MNSALKGYKTLCANPDQMNLVPDVVKNIKETISLPCDFKIDSRVEDETSFIWLKNSEPLDLGPESKYSLLPNKSLLLQNLSLKVNQ